MKAAEIIKALEFCSSEHLGCEDGCPYLPTKCGTDMLKDTLDLIKRQKAEIEELSKCIVSLDEKNQKQSEGIQRVAKMFVVDSNKIRAEAIKEFAERLKDHLHRTGIAGIEDIDILVKEMVGDAE